MYGGRNRLRGGRKEVAQGDTPRKKKVEILLFAEAHPCFPVGPSRGWRRQGEEGEEEEARVAIRQEPELPAAQEGRVELDPPSY